MDFLLKILLILTLALQISGSLLVVKAESNFFENKMVKSNPIEAESANLFFYSKNCGGFIDVVKIPYLNFTSNGNDTQICFWVVWSSKPYHNFEVNTLTSTVPRENLKITWGFSYTQGLKMSGFLSDPISRSVDLGIITFRRDESTVDPEHFSVRFSHEPTSSKLVGLNIHYQAFGSFGGGTTAGGTNVQKLRYPADGGQYKNNERAFFFFTPDSKNSAVSIDIQRLDTELPLDSLVIYRLSNADLSFHYDQSYSGSKKKESFIGRPGEPILLFFVTNDLITNSGFKISYQNQ